MPPKKATKHPRAPPRGKARAKGVRPQTSRSRSPRADDQGESTTPSTEMSMGAMKSLLVDTSQQIHLQMDSLFKKMESIEKQHAPTDDTTTTQPPPPPTDNTDAPIVNQPPPPPPAELPPLAPSVRTGPGECVSGDSSALMSVRAGGGRRSRPLYAPSAPAVHDSSADYTIDAGAFSQALHGLLAPTPDIHATAATASFMMAGSHVPLKIKTQIRQGEYVLLGLMEPKSSSASAKMGVQWSSTATASALSFTPTQTPRAHNKDQWLKWFLTYSTIYTQTYPDAAPEIFTYILNMLQLFANPAYTFEQVIKYDELFRFAKASDPLLPWHKYELQLLASTGISLFGAKNPRQPGSTTTPSTASGFCYAFNSPGKRCQNDACKHIHQCSICRGAHPKYRCPRSSSKQPDNTKPATRSSSKQPSKSRRD